MSRNEHLISDMLSLITINKNIGMTETNLRMVATRMKGCVVLGVFVCQIRQPLLF
jgi:DNA-binding transcriptional regulator PaaX